MLLSKGLHGRERILSRPAVELMTSDQLTPEQRQGAELFFGHGASWGMGGAVVTRRTDLCTRPVVTAGTAATARRAISIRPRTWSAS